MGAAGIKTDVTLREALQVVVWVDKTWLMGGIAYLLAINMPIGILAVDKLEVPVDKNLVIVETYLLMKPDRWDFVIKKKKTFYL